MANVLSREKREQVLALGRLGWSLRRIEEATGVRRETAGTYLKEAGVAVRGPRKRRLGSRLPDAAEAASDLVGSKPASEVSTDSADQICPGRCPSASACEPYCEFIERSLDKGRNAMAIWQDLVDDHEFKARYSSVKRFVRKLQSRPGRQARCVITTAPGQEAQVDYGTGPMVRHPDTGKYQRTRLFVLTLAYSRKAVRLLTFRSSCRIWVELHERAFRRLGGVARLVVPDNLKEGVLKPDIYDPEINPLYREMLKHYGAVAMPCRVRNPDRKGKVERAVGHAKGTPLKGLRFESLDQAQAYLDRWEERWADTRIHGTTKRQVQAMFAEELPSLLPLPIEPFRYYEFGHRTVTESGDVEVQGAYYGTPPGWLCKQVNVEWDQTHVRIKDPRTDELLREHLVQSPGGRRMEPRDRPKQTPKTTQELIERAHKAGADVGRLCAEIHKRDGEPGVQRIRGVLSLVKQYGASVVNDASAMAVDLNTPDYRFVRRYLKRRNPEPLTLRQIDPLIRRLTHYRDVINRMTEGDTL